MSAYTDAQMAAEAWEVCRECGLTPRQLADEVMDLGRRIAETQAELSRIYAARDALADDKTRLAQHVRNLSAECSQLADQRAELLAALHELLPALMSKSAMMDRHDWMAVETANAAIARAEAVPK